MHEDSAILLIKVLDRSRFRVQFYCSRHRSGKLLVRQVDACDLRIERAGNEGANKGSIGVRAVERRSRADVLWYEANFAQG